MSAGFDPFARGIWSRNGWRTPAGGGSLPVVDPSTLEPVGELAEVDAAGVEEVLAEAAAAQRG